jgi:hypothetical protein
MRFNELYFRVHVQLSRRERLCVRVLQALIIRDDAIYRFGLVNSFGVSEPSPTQRASAHFHGDALCSPILGISRILSRRLTKKHFSFYNVRLI